MTTHSSRPTSADVLVVGAGPAGSAAAAWAARGGASVVRVHDVAETRRFLAVWSAIDDAGCPA